MAKETTEVVSLAQVGDKFANVLAEYGITPEQVSEAPQPTTGTPGNFVELCELTDPPLYDQFDNEIEDVIGYSGPIMFLAKKGETDAQDFDGYDGFYIYEILHPVKGKMIRTLGRPEGDDKPALATYLDSLTPGMVFNVARIKTRKGFGVLNPAPLPRPQV